MFTQCFIKTCPLWFDSPLCLLLWLGPLPPFCCHKISMLQCTSWQLLMANKVLPLSCLPNKATPFAFSKTNRRIKQRKIPNYPCHGCFSATISRLSTVSQCQEMANKSSIWLIRLSVGVAWKWGKSAPKPPNFPFPNQPKQLTAQVPLIVDHTNPSCPTDRPTVVFWCARATW